MRTSAGEGGQLGGAPVALARIVDSVCRAAAANLGVLGRCGGVFERAWDVGRMHARSLRYGGIPARPGCTHGQRSRGKPALPGGAAAGCDSAGIAGAAGTASNGGACRWRVLPLRWARAAATRPAASGHDLNGHRAAGEVELPQPAGRKLDGAAGGQAPPPGPQRAGVLADRQPAPGELVGPQDQPFPWGQPGRPLPGCAAGRRQVPAPTA
jgi:hypothetical protein